MGQSVNNEADPKQIKEAQESWHIFTVFTKWVCISIALLLGAMALFLL